MNTITFNTNCVGERSGHKFQLADKLKIKVAAVSIDDRKIDFEFVEKL